MICRRCLLSLPPSSPSTLPLLFPLLPLRHHLQYSTSSPASTSTPPPATSTSAAQPFSTPFTPTPKVDPEYQSAIHDSSLPNKISSGKAPPPPKSSIPVGTVLRGLGFVKGKEAPVAKEDEEYPEWLWGLLGDKGTKGGMGDGGEGGDEFAKSKKQRRLAAKSQRRALARSAASGGPPAPQIPLDQQSIDLPSAGQSRSSSSTSSFYSAASSSNSTSSSSAAAASITKRGSGARKIEHREEITYGEAQEAREELTGVMRKTRRKGIKEANFLRGMR